MIAEADRWSGMVQDRDLREAGLIASAQRIEHHEIAVHGTLATWVKQLGLEEDMNVLLSIPDEGKRTEQSRLVRRLRCSEQPDPRIWSS
jgi:ferritin-like metal-binding protein YciE